MKNKLLSILILISLSSQAQLMTLRVQDTTTVFNQNVPMGSVIYDNTLKKYWGVVLSQASTRKLSQCVVNTDIKELTNPVNPTLSNKFIVQGTTDAGLTGAQFLGALGTGIVKNTTSTGVLSIATGADLPAMTSTVGGAVPTPPNNTTTFLRGDGNFGSAVELVSSGLGLSGGSITYTGTIALDTASSVVLSRQRAANTYQTKFSGTAGYLPYFATSSTLGNSPAYTDGINIGIGSSPAQKLDVYGKIALSGLTFAYAPINGAYATLFIGDGGGKITHTSGIDGFDNTFTGFGSGDSITVGYFNTGVGEGSLQNTKNGYSNTGLGYISLWNNVSGYGNTAVGEAALYSTTSVYNTAVGQQALYQSTSGFYNTAIGAGALGSITTSSYNTANGNFAGGSYGGGSGYNLTSVDSSVFIGYRTRAAANGDRNEIVIGHNALGNGSATATIGNSYLLRTYLTGVNLKASPGTAGTAPLKINSGTLLTTTEAGAIENNGTHLYYTPVSSGTRYQLDQQSSGSGTVTSVGTGLGLTGGTITTSGTVSLDTTSSVVLSRQRAANTYQSKFSGTAGYIPKFATSTTLGNSLIQDNGSAVSLTGTTDYPFTLKGSSGGGLIFGDGLGSSPVSGAIWSALNSSGTALTPSSTNYSLGIGPLGTLDLNIPTAGYGINMDIGGSQKFGMTVNGGMYLGNAFYNLGNNTTLPAGDMVIQNDLGIGLGLTGSAGSAPIVPSANLHLGAGTATAGTAPLKINSGTLLSTTEAGAIENNGTHLYYTPVSSGTRYQLDQQSSGSGTVTSVSVTTANGVSGTVATATTTPAITLSLGAITPTSTNGVSAATMGYLDATSSVQTQLNSKVATGGALGTPTSGTLTNCTFPTLNQSTTGSAATLTTARTLAGNSFNGSANVPFSNKFIVQGTTDAGLTGAQFLGALGTGIVKNTTSTGVLSIATGADLPAMSATVGGAVPTPPNVATKYLDGTGAWSTPNGGSGTVTSITMGDGLASTQSPLTTSGTMKVDTSQTMILSRQRAANTYALKGSVSGPSNHRQVYNASPIYLPFIGTTYSYLGPFTITYIPAGNHALIMFSATVGVSAISQTGSIALYVGSVTPTYVQSMYFNLYAGYAPMSFQTLQSVTAGTSTTYSIYWYGSSTGNSINYGTFTIIDLP